MNILGSNQFNRHAMPCIFEMNTKMTCIKIRCTITEASTCHNTSTRFVENKNSSARLLMQNCVEIQCVIPLLTQTI